MAAPAAGGDRIRAVHVAGIPPEALRGPLQELLPGVEVRGFADETDFARRLPEVEVLFAFRPPRGHWARATRLRLIQTVGAGVDAVLPAPDLPEGVQIANARGVHAAQMGEYALGMMLHFARRMPELLDQQRRREWRMLAPSLLRGATCGVLGLGAIGEAVGERARAFGMRVLGTRRDPRPSPHADRVVGPEETEAVLAESDYVVVVLPLTKETRGRLGAEALAHLRPEAVLVNMARGGILDETALAAMLREGRLRGAALDVFEEEPLPASSPLWDVPNLVITPHLAGFSRDYLPAVLGIFAENVRRLERGEPLRNLVDRQRGY